MNYGVRRLTAYDGVTRYHLFDDEHRLILVADRDSPWLSTEVHRFVCLARPDGAPVASLDLPWGSRYTSRLDVELTAYVLIREHAVYAIINEYRRRGKGRPLPYYILEVEEGLWLAMAHNPVEPAFTLYDEVPKDLEAYEALSEADLPPPIGRIAPARGDYDITVDLATGRLEHADLVILSLVYLIDQAIR
ncbi:MAG: hypothetical protein L0331_10970 [Chloroflexi bacterium]|nr:hypothetical protein [Chloroflexota bacterium]